MRSAVLRPEEGTDGWALTARLTYFKQLQMLSDEVADPEFNHNFRGFPTELRLLDEDAGERWPSDALDRRTLTDVLCPLAEKLEAEIDVKSRSSRYLNSLAEGHSKEVDTTCECVCAISKAPLVAHVTASLQASSARRFTPKAFSQSAAICSVM